MQKLILLLLVPALFACSNSDSGPEKQNGEPATKAAAPETRKSIPSETAASIGGTEFRINYTAPAVRGRKIWGGLVPYGKVWVTGAHNATALTAGKDFQVGGRTIPAGKYAFFTIPGEQEWTVVLNKNWDQHQADEYAQAEDVVRLKVNPETTGSLTERLQYQIQPTGPQTGNIVMSWEKIRITVPVSVVN